MYFFIIIVLLFSRAAIAGNVDYDKELDTIEQSLKTDIGYAIEKIDIALSSESLLTSPQHSRLYMLLGTKNLYLGHFLEADKALDKALTYDPLGEELTNIYLLKTTANIGLSNYKKAFALLEDNLSRIDSYQD